MSNLFPFLSRQIINTSKKTLPMYTEIKWDFNTNSMVIENGEPVIVYGAMAVKTWAYHTLSCERFRHLIFSWHYGCEAKSLIGKNYNTNLSEAEFKRFVEEALLINPYITDVKLMEFKFFEGTLDATIEITTIYGKESLNV